MIQKPTPLACSRCRAPLDARVAADHVLRFDDREHALCAACWEALASWMAAQRRVRMGEAA